MNLKFLAVVFLSLSSIFIINSAFAQTSNDNMHVVINTEGHSKTIDIPLSQMLFKIIPHYDANGISSYNTIDLSPDRKSLYSQVGLSSPDNKIAFVYPIFTQAAYGKLGFYDYYKKTCDSSCLTISIPEQIQGGYSSSFKTASILALLNYSQITDIDIDKNPDILKKYDKVIVLHNEYVTKKEFDSITAHPNVVFLFPNALYAEVKTDYDKNTITLVKGHGYPNSNFTNGLDWKYDNSKYEFDPECNNWNFYDKADYTFLNCYPEYRMLYDEKLLRSIHSDDPIDLTNGITNWVRYNDDNKYATVVLKNYDLQGNHIPNWAKRVATMVLNEELDEDNFRDMLAYLVEKGVIKD